MCYRLFDFPNNASLAPHILPEETGADFELVLVDRSARGQKDPDYLRLNPNGRIPTLVDGDLVLFEAAAICMHIADRHPEAMLIPPLRSDERSHFYKWLVFLTNTVQPPDQVPRKTSTVGPSSQACSPSPSQATCSTPPGSSTSTS
ncbi:MAG: hypothetical protein GY723_19495 [bacterium]|nr:hypothetical protein [bacterium]